jgi:hypothetical protein
MMSHLLCNHQCRLRAIILRRSIIANAHVEKPA